MSGEAKENMMALSTLVEYVRKQVRIIIIGQCRVLVLPIGESLRYDQLT